MSSKILLNIEPRKVKHVLNIFWNCNFLICFKNIELLFQNVNKHYVTLIKRFWFACFVIIKKVEDGERLSIRMNDEVKSNKKEW